MVTISKKIFGHESHYEVQKKWGGYEKQLYWYYDLPVGEPLPGLNQKNKKFGAAISVWKKLPVKVSNLIGPQIVKNLP